MREALHRGQGCHVALAALFQAQERTAGICLKGPRSSLGGGKRSTQLWWSKLPCILGQVRSRATYKPRHNMRNNLTVFFVRNVGARHTAAPNNVQAGWPVNLSCRPGSRANAACEPEESLVINDRRFRMSTQPRQNTQTLAPQHQKHLKAKGATAARAYCSCAPSNGLTRRNTICTVSTSRKRLSLHAEFHDWGAQRHQKLQQR